MFGLGLGELMVIMIVVLVIFGGSRLPELGRGLGEGMRSFRDAIKGEGKKGAEPPGQSLGDDGGGSGKKSNKGPFEP